MPISLEYPDREKWLAARKHHIGASDVAAILGVNPYKSAYTLWAEKSGLLPESDNSLPARVGMALEGLVTSLYEEETQVKTTNPGDFTFFVHEDYPFWTCTPDRLVFDDDVIKRAVELKTIGEQAARNLKDGEPPLAYQVQLQSQLAVLGVDEGDLACLIGNRSFEIFPFRRHEKLISKITSRVNEFFQRIIDRNPPSVDGSDSTYRTLALLHPDDNGETIDLPPSLIEAARNLENYKIILKDIEAKEQAAKNQIIEALGDATFCVGDGLKFSYKTQERSGALKVSTEYRQALESAGIEFTETKASKFRVLRSVKGQSK
jgi:putative phage-type endonuclease